MWRDLIDVGRHLINGVDAEPPTNAALRRSISTAYYALFAATSALLADELVGTSAASRSSLAWTRAHRSLEHGYTKNIAKELETKSQNVEVRNWALAFHTLQDRRHIADYHPHYEITVEEATDLLGMAHDGAEALDRMAGEIRQDFASQLAFRGRK